MASKIWRNLIRTAAAACFVAGSGAQAAGRFYQSDFAPVRRQRGLIRVDERAASRLAWSAPMMAVICRRRLYSVTLLT